MVSEIVDLLQRLIRNTCVNDGSEASGNETKSVEVLASYLAGCGADLERYEPRPGRQSLVAKFAGTDPAAPSLMFMGHTDVVPVNSSRWQRDPFAGEIVDGYVWGRGAVDLLCQTACMAVAFRRLGLLAVADSHAQATLKPRALDGMVVLAPFAIAGACSRGRRSRVETGVTMSSEASRWRSN